MIARIKTSGSLLVLAGFIVWLGYGRIFGSHAAWPLSSGYFVEVTAVFLVICFLPDHRPTTFYSMRSALALMGLSLWLATRQISIFLPKDPSGNSMWDPSFDVVISLALALGSYWLSIILIRRFRMSSESTIVKAAQSADDKPPEAD